MVIMEELLEHIERATESEGIAPFSVLIGDCLVQLLDRPPPHAHATLLEGSRRTPDRSCSRHHTVARKKRANVADYVRRLCRKACSSPLPQILFTLMPDSHDSHGRFVLNFKEGNISSRATFDHQFAREPLA